MSQNLVNICVAHGDGIGPEIMDATLQILKAAGAQINCIEVEVGEKVFLQGHSSGIRPDTWDLLKANRVLLKAPITTPQGGGFKSLNVTIRTTMGLFANVRPSLSFHPYVETMFPNLDVVVVRENEEDLYSGIEHQQTDDMVQVLKLISRPGSERIIRYAFEYARANNRKKVSCFVKDNIMKMSDGLFHRIFKEVALEYPEIKTDSWIIDIACARLATEPDRFDVIVTENLYGDIISDITAELSGSVGLGGSSNIGENFAMFEAIHGSAPDIAGQGIANPSGLLLAAVQMLIHINQKDAATRVHNAWLKTIEDGIHTGDIYKKGISNRKVSTSEFAQAIIDRLGERPKILKEAVYNTENSEAIATSNLIRPVKLKKKVLVGVDVFLEADTAVYSPDKLGQEVSEKIQVANMKLTLISNRGQKVWPDNESEALVTRHWRCRFEWTGVAGEMKHTDILQVLAQFDEKGFDFIKTEHLYTFDGALGYSLAQGQ